MSGEARSAVRPPAGWASLAAAKVALDRRRGLQAHAEHFLAWLEPVVESMNREPDDDPWADMPTPPDVTPHHGKDRVVVPQSLWDTLS